MTLILKILAVGLIHLALFASYPETGPVGKYYLGVSLLVWCVFIMFINTSAKLVRFISGGAGLIVNIAAFALIALSIAVTMPQRDRTSVMEKIQDGKYPDRATINSGLERLGIHLDKEVEKGVERVNLEAGKALEKIKEAE
jgi:Arc/MetJ-type ribon-helix-helix transcriptional regulator